MNTYTHVILQGQAMKDIILWPLVGVAVLVSVTALLPEAERAVDSNCGISGMERTAVAAARHWVREPESFERTGNLQISKSDPVTCAFEVMFEFRARNGFGGMNNGIAIVDVRAPRTGDMTAGNVRLVE